MIIYFKDKYLNITITVVIMLILLFPSIALCAHWARTYGTDSYIEVVYPAASTSDGGYLVAGSTNVSSYDYLVVKLDGEGNILWQKAYGGTDEDMAESVVQTDDGGGIIVGTTYSHVVDQCDLWILKLDAGGNTVWDKIYGAGDSGGYDYGRSLEQTS